MTAGIWKISSTLWALGWLMWTSAHAAAQSTSDLTEQRARAATLEKRLPVPKVTPKSSFDLSPPRQERFQKYLPKAWTKLIQHEPLHLLILGDAPLLKVHEASANETFPWAFARELAAQFFYTGGAQEAQGNQADTHAPAISVRTLTREEGSVLDASAILASTARQSPVDVLLLCYGASQSRLSPVEFSDAITATLAGAKELGAEVILCSPWLPMAEASEMVLGVERPASDALREVAVETGVLSVDLGNLAQLVTMPATKTRNVEQVFERIERTYRALFYQDSVGQFTPRVQMHRLMGSMIFNALIEAPAGPSWKISDAMAQVNESKLTLTCTLRNPGKSPLDLVTLPLIASGWTPIAAQSSVRVEAGKSQSITMNYERKMTAEALQEPLLRMPVLMCAGSDARIETLRAMVQPVAVVWGMETLFNQEAATPVSCQIVNTSPESVKGTWQAEFEGQKLSGSYDIPKGSAEPLNLRFELPLHKEGSLPLRLTVIQGEQTTVETRQVLLTRNLGLNKAVPLIAIPTQKRHGPTLTASADASRLTLTCQLPRADLLQDTPDGLSPAWQMQVHLDARSYGKRLEQGSTAAITAAGKAMEGPGKVHPIPAWAFGTGYAAGYAPKEFTAVLTGTDDSRQITFTLPRSYLYLHEWALDNGNSQLGLNVRLTLNTADGFVTYCLAPTFKPADSVDALAVLELTQQATQRMTVSVE